MSLQIKYYLAVGGTGREFFFAFAYISPFVRYQRLARFLSLPCRSLRLIFLPSHARLRKKPVSRGALTLDYRGVNTGNGSRYPNQYFRMPFLKIDPTPQTLPISPFRVWTLTCIFTYPCTSIEAGSRLWTSRTIGWAVYVLNSVEGRSPEVSNPVWKQIIERLQTWRRYWIFSALHIISASVRLNWPLNRMTNLRFAVHGKYNSADVS